jgi:phosphoribosylglycinamide formyltransferase-1
MAEAPGRRRVAVLISGRGSNLQALIEACAGGNSAAEIALVLSNVPGAAGLDRARAAGVAAVAIDHRTFPDRESFETRVTAALEEAAIDLVCLAGFMRLLTAGFVERWRDRLINIHPSLLPAYKGLNTHERAIADGVRFAGCTVHFVRAEMDAGPIIVQAAVPVHPDDDADSLAARVLTAEHRCYPLALRLIADGRVRIDNETVRIDGAAPPPPVMLNPDDGLRQSGT